ncbi:Hypothetical protein R9X50_00199900 [Acrodontium crateriforme]|uniref:Uncharacterized protein n=1 Tax=Acrodontium crateriforme TaxID=150365 RepID=A0AAQ3R698_9PEZI|nr:Hypothetical protein R9X50_00199900 [Acrodontium crateriforme]
MLSFNLLLVLGLTGLLGRVKAYYEPINDVLRQEILDYDQSRTTTTIPITRHVTLTVTEMAGAAAPATAAATPTPTTLVSEIRPVPKTWYGAQRQHGCDRTACASCRYWYACQMGDRTCAKECDQEPYCDCDANEISLDEGKRVDVVPAPFKYESYSLRPVRTASCHGMPRAYAFYFGKKWPTASLDHPRNFRGKRQNGFHVVKPA